VLLNFFGGQHIVQRIVQRTANYGVIFSKRSPGKNPSAFAGFDCGSRQNDSRNVSFAQRGQRHRHGQISFACARRADAERDVVLADCVEIFFSGRRFWP